MSMITIPEEKALAALLLSPIKSIEHTFDSVGGTIASLTFIMENGQKVKIETNCYYGLELKETS